MADVNRALAQAPRLPVGIVQDAAPELWTLLRTALTAETRLRLWHEGIDRYHLNERLAEILRLVESDARRRHQQLRRWNTALDTDDRAIDRIVRWIAQQIPAYDGEALATLEAHWTYRGEQQRSHALCHLAPRRLAVRKRCHRRRLQVGRHHAHQAERATLACRWRHRRPESAGHLSQ
jgi:hypothetical protein